MLFKNGRVDPALVKAGPDDGLKDYQFVVYPSTFTRQPDAYGDVVAPGAFERGIEERKASGNVLPGLFGHRMDDPDFWVAWAIEESEDDHGWRVFGEFDGADAKAQKVYRLVKGRRLRELSFAYDTLAEGEVELEGGEKANELRDLETFEFSFVPIGANRDTSVVAVKTAVEALVDGMKTGRVLSAQNEKTLRGVVDSLGTTVEDLKSLLAQLESGETSQGKASATLPGNAEDPLGDNAEDSVAVKASARLLGLIEISTAL
jgi:HK97 family phage prohead protease